MKDKLYVDDVRLPPDDTWDYAKSSNEALAMLQGRDYRTVSLDHDLGGDDTTRRIVLHWCENGGWPQRIVIHSTNPVGVDWLRGMCERYAPEDTKVLILS